MRSLARRRIAALLLFLVWPAAEGPAQTPDAPWQNVEFLAGVSEADMDVYMGAMNVSLGVGCDYCHESGAWHLDTLPAKTTARSMMRMIASLGEGPFEALDLPSCWTCHRGSVEPGSRPASGLRRVDSPVGAFSTSTEPGGRVYESLELFGDLPARDLAVVMEAWSASLGVGCAYCHEGSDWPSDGNVNKLLARQMHRVSLDLDGAFFGGQGAVTCWTCHRGEAVPAVRLLE